MAAQDWATVLCKEMEVECDVLEAEGNLEGVLVLPPRSASTRLIQQRRSYPPPSLIVSRKSASILREGYQQHSLVPSSVGVDTHPSPRVRKREHEVCPTNVKDLEFL